MNQEYKNTYGTWEVSTDANWDGATKILGVFIGHVDEIALHLADRCNDKLLFKKLYVRYNDTQIDWYAPKSDRAVISYAPESGTLGILTKTKDGLEEIANVFKDRPVTVLKSMYYGSFLIISKKT